MEFVTVCTPEGAQVRRDIDESVVRIGRASANDIVLSGTGISRCHAEIARRPGGLLLTDFNSRNGTFVNDQRIAAPVSLSSGDRIRIGDNLLILNALEGSPVTYTGEEIHRGPGTVFLGADEFMTSLPGDATPPPSPRAAAIVLEAEKKIVVSRPLNEILENLMDLAHRVASYERGLILQFRDDEILREVVRLPATETSREFTVSRAIIDHVRRTGEAFLTCDALTDKELEGSASIHDQQVRSIMCVPFINEGEVVGLIYLDNRQQAGMFSLEDLRVLGFLACIAAVKIENAHLFADAVERRRRDHEFAEAASIQTRFLPDRAPGIPGYRLDGVTYPCHEVGGDFYDFIELPGGRVGIAFGDVAGKGLPAAMLMSNLLASLRSCIEFDPPVDLLIERLNRQACRSFPIDRFVTFFYGVLDPRSHTLTWANAGHCSPYIVRDGVPAIRLAPGGLPLGLDAGFAYHSAVQPLEPGDSLVCFSDGVTEARNDDEEEFGEDRLELILRGRNGATPRQFMEGIVGAIDAHCGSRRYEDDLTMLVLHRTTGAADVA